MQKTNKRDDILNRWLGNEDVYDKYRPKPPAELLDVLVHMVGGNKPKLVVDLGAGTGLSTRVWADRAERVIGIEPSRSMFTAAVSKPGTPNVSYRNVFAEETGLEEASVDVVTASSSLHWMHPARTTTEIARILRPGGVFCAFGVRNPLPLGFLSLEQAIFRFREHCDALLEDDIGTSGQRWKWGDHQQALADSPGFADVREVWIHSILQWDVDDLANWLRSLACVDKLRKRQITEKQAGLETLCDEVAARLGRGKAPWLFQWKLLVAVRG